MSCSGDQHPGRCRHAVQEESWWHWCMQTLEDWLPGPAILCFGIPGASSLGSGWAFSRSRR